MAEREKRLTITVRGRTLERLDHAKDLLNELFFFGTRSVTWECLFNMLLDHLNDYRASDEWLREALLRHKPKMGPRKRKGDEVDSWV